MAEKWSPRLRRGRLVAGTSSWRRDSDKSWCARDRRRRLVSVAFCITPGATWQLRNFSAWGVAAKLRPSCCQVAAKLPPSCVQVARRSIPDWECIELSPYPPGVWCAPASRLPPGGEKGGEKGTGVFTRELGMITMAAQLVWRPLAVVPARTVPPSINDPRSLIPPWPQTRSHGPGTRKVKQ